MHSKLLKEKKGVSWKNCMFSFLIIEEVRLAVTSLSAQCYPFGKNVTPALAFEKGFETEVHPIFTFSENELHDLIFTKER